MEVDEIGQVRNLLCSVDFLLEPTITLTLPKYVRLGGVPAEAIQFLSSNYRGSAQMINLLVEWLTLTGIAEEEISKTVEEYIKDLVLQHFDPDVATKYFIDYPDDADACLTQMIHHSQWRSLLCDLSNKHENCTLLDFAIKKISDAGYQSEIATVATASAFIEVFNRVMVDSLNGIITKDPHSLPPNAMADFAKLVCSTSYTYLYAQALLRGMENEENSHILSYVSQEITSAARAEGRSVVRLSLLLSGASKYPPVAIALLSILQNKRVVPKDITALHQQYSSPNPPSVELIRVYELFDMLVNVIYNPRKNVLTNPVIKKKYIYLLALMASTQKDNDRSDLDKTIASIDATLEICLRNAIRYQSPHEVAILMKEMTVPVVCCGLISWVDVNLQEPGYYQLEYATTREVPIHLALLDQIANKQELLRPRIFKILCKALESESGLDPLLTIELKRIIIDRMMHLISLGFVLDVLIYWRTNAQSQSVEASLLRYFVSEFVRSVEAPFDFRIVGAIILTVSGFEQAVNTEECSSLLKDFFANCSEENLSPKEIKQLNLQKKRLNMVVEEK